MIKLSVSCRLSYLTLIHYYEWMLVIPMFNMDPLLRIG